MPNKQVCISCACAELMHSASSSSWGVLAPSLANFLILFSARYDPNAHVQLRRIHTQCISTTHSRTFFSENFQQRKLHIHQVYFQEMPENMSYDVWQCTKHMNESYHGDLVLCMWLPPALPRGSLPILVGGKLPSFLAVRTAFASSITEEHTSTSRIGELPRFGRK